MAVILVVDDDPDVLEVCRLLLEKEGHEVFLARSSSDGESLINSAKPNLIILDVMMDNPDDGIVLARKARRSGVDAPILMLTAINEVSEMVFGGDSEVTPVDEFVAKPIDSRAFISLVDKLLKPREK